MAGKHPYTKTADQIATIALSVPGITVVDKGYVRFSDSENWESIIESQTAGTQGRFSFSWDEATIYGKMQSNPGSCRFCGQLAVYIPKDTSSDMNEAIELALALADKIVDASNYTTGAAYPTEINVALERIDVTTTGGIAFFNYGVPGSGSMVFIDDYK